MMGLFSSGEDGKRKEIEELVQSLEVPANIPNAALGLVDLSTDPDAAAVICEIGLPAIFTAIIHSKLDDVTISDLFELLNNLMKDNTNALRIVGEELALPVLLDCADTQNPKKRLAVIRIITRLAILEPALLQKAIGNDQDRLVHFLSLVNVDDPEFLAEFLNLIGILVVGNENFQQMFAFYALDRLIQLVQMKRAGAMSALRAILSGNSNTQTLFFASNQLDSLAPLLEEADPETMALLIDLFSGEKASNFRDALKSSRIFEVVYEKAREGSEQFVRLLGLFVKGNDEMSKAIEQGIPGMLDMYLKSADDLSDLFFLSFFKNYLYKLENNAVTLVGCIVNVDDRNSGKLINLATLCVIMCSESRRVFVDAANSFVISMIGFLISGLNLEFVLPFLICFCYNSNAAASEIINESSQPLVFVFEMLSREDLGKIIHAQLCLFVKVLLPFLTEVPETLSIEQIDATVKDFATYLSTIDKTDALTYDETIIKELFDENQREVSAPVSEEVVHEEPPKEPQIEMPEERKEVNFDEMKDKFQGDNMENVVENYEIMFQQMKQELLEQKLYYEEQMRKMVEQSRTLALKTVSSDGSLNRVASESMQAQMQSYREELNREKEILIDRHDREIENEREISKRDIESWRRRCDDLQSSLDATRVNHQREMAEMRSDFLSKEMWYQSEIQSLKNTNNERICSISSDLRRECRSVMTELNLYKAKQQALLNEQLDNLREQKRKVDKILNENGYLKYQISQLIKEKNSLQTEIDSLKKRIEGHSMIDAEHKLYQQQLKTAQNQILELMRGSQSTSPSDAMISSYEKVQVLNNDLTRQLEELRSQKESLTLENSDLRSQNSELVADLRAKETHASNTSGEIEKLKKLTKKLNNENKKEKADNAKLRTDLGVCQTRIEELERQCETSTARQKDLIEKEQTTRNQLNEKQKQLEKLQQKLASLDSDLQEVRAKKESSPEVSSIKVKYQTLKSENQSLKEQLEKVKEQHVEKVAEVSQNMQTISDLQRKLAQTEAENQKLKKMNDKYLAKETQSGAEGERIRDLSQQVLALERDKLDLQTVCEKRKMKLQNYKSQVKKAEDEFRAVKSCVTAKMEAMNDRYREFAQDVASHVCSAKDSLSSVASKASTPPKKTMKVKVATPITPSRERSEQSIASIAPFVDSSGNASSFLQLDFSSSVVHDFRDGEGRIALLEETNRALKQDQQDLDQRNKKLRAENVELKQTIETLKSGENGCENCAVLRTRNCEMQKKLRKSQEQTISLLTQNKELLKQITDLNLCLANSGVDHESASLKVELEAKDEENQRLREEIHFLKSETVKVIRDRSNDDPLACFGSPRSVHRSSLPSRILPF